MQVRAGGMASAAKRHPRSAKMLNNSFGDLLDALELLVKVHLRHPAHLDSLGLPERPPGTAVRCPSVEWLSRAPAHFRSLTLGPSLPSFPSFPSSPYWELRPLGDREGERGWLCSDREGAYRPGRHVARSPGRAPGTGHQAAGVKDRPRHPIRDAEGLLYLVDRRGVRPPPGALHGRDDALRTSPWTPSCPYG